MNSKPLLSLDDAARIVHADPAIIRRAVANGITLPLEPHEPYFFTPEEVQSWSDKSKRLELFGRLGRNSQGAFNGRYPEPGEFRQRNRYVLPFSGCWLVIDGGDIHTADGRVRNTHYYVEPCFRWASDLVAIAREDYGKCRVGMTDREIMALRMRAGQAENTPDFERSESEADPFKSWGGVLNREGLDNRINFQYGLDIVVPADGVFLTRQGASNDGEFNAQVAALKREGLEDEKEFLIDHGQGELSQFGHVLGRSIRVRPGERVSQGQVLCTAAGRCRHETLPHLHWAVRDHCNDCLAAALPVTISACEIYEHGAFVKRQDVWLQRGMLVQNVH